MMKSFLASVAFFAVGALAQTPPITVTQPLSAFNWTTCTPQIIAWVNPVGATISQIYLDQGPSTALQKILLIGTDVPTGPAKLNWTPPSSLATGQYSLEFGTAPNIAYAGPFTITNSGTSCGSASGSQAPPAPASKSGASSVAPASSAASAASAASSAAASVASSAAASDASVASVASSAVNTAATTAAASGSGSATSASVASSAVRPSSLSSMALVAVLSLIVAVAALL